MQNLIRILSTACFIGYMPLMPGTYASALGLFLTVLFGQMRFFYFLLTGILLIAGFLVCGRAERLFNEKDSSKIVIDETAGIMLAYCLVPLNPLNLILGFILFRAFDVLKPFPIKQIQRIPGSAGIMLDDMLAALYTAGVLFALRFFMV
ncbi:MAG: phosphatidylglycerophosphatase A [Candidatus Omnitrophica bacterium]|nr:phosphatidylglycerophosphatase A [Candidatus Omnitrophota bacterium]MBU4479190.1 phosphatidylglycerophosphatase A [Candidatus Omnitrophota bacterium]MCG2704194.1 phosphatidylglycerophosphatase A [Candidatus Omnitrophota bacterium]